MSCGSPHEHDCSEVLGWVYSYLDGEMGDEECAHVRSHLDDCGPCLRAYGVEKEFKALLARKCGCDPAPTELRTRVLARLTEVRLQFDHVEFRAE